MANAADIAWDGERVMAASLEPMAVVDGTQFVSLNQAYADLYGFAHPDDLTGELWAPRLADPDRERFVHDVLPACRENGQWQGKLTGCRQDGTPFEQEASLTQMADEQFVWVARERTDEPLAASDSERPHSFSERMVDAVADLVYVVDEDDNIVQWNARLTERLGYADDDIAELEFSDLFPASQHGDVPERDRQLVDLPAYTRERDLVTTDGEAIPHEIREVTIADEDAEEQYRVGVARDITERTEREQELQQYETIVETIDDGVYVLDEDMRITFVNDAFCDRLGRSREDVLGTKAIQYLIHEDERNAVDALRERLVAGETNAGTFEVSGVGPGGDRAYEVRSRLHPEPNGNFRGSVGVVRDITERKQRERDLQRQRDEMETLNRINELLLELTTELVETPTRDAIERRVCEHLAASELYQFAWIGEPETNGDRIVPRASAGIETGDIDAVSRISTEAEPGHGPGERALRTGEVQVTHDVRTDPMFEPWRDAALDRGVQSAAVVPLVHDDATYGVLAVYATRPLAFSHREQAGFATLGKALGFVINATENRNLLFADTVVELEFVVSTSELVFVHASEQLDCDLTVTGYVASETEGWSVYLRVEGAPPAALRELMADDPDVKQVRTITEADDAGLVEVVMNGPALNELTGHKAMLTSGHVGDGRGRFCIELPQTADVRRVVDRLQATYPESRLVAQREFDRPVLKARELRQSIDDRLTERQQEALYRAHHAGYFEWPRTSTAGDVAASMDIAETTFHYHLRTALDKLLAGLTDVKASD